MNITLRTREKMVLIAASDKPNILKLTSLQLILFCFNCSKISSFERFSDKFSAMHANVSLKKPVQYRNGKKLESALPINIIEIILIK